MGWEQIEEKILNDAGPVVTLAIIEAADKLSNNGQMSYEDALVKVYTMFKETGNIPTS